MTYNKKSIEDIDVAGKRVLVRCDFNVPVKDGVITSDKRITEALPTIKYLLDKNCKVVLCSHMGKPHNVFDKEVKLNKKELAKIAELPEAEQAEATAKALKKAEGDKEKFSLKIVADKLNELLGNVVTFAEDTVGPDAQAKVAALEGGKAVLLENTRFTKGEEKNDEAFSKELAKFGEIFVNDAFGTAHRAHASTAGVAMYGGLPAVCGYLIQKEITVMGKALEDPKRPFVAVLGGAKVSDKIGVINNLLDKVDMLIVGGGMAYTFLRAKGYSTGTSICEEDKLDLARELMDKAKAKGVYLILPVDNIIGRTYEEDTIFMRIYSNAIPDGWMGLDIGEKTRELFSKSIIGAGTVVWNGPMGVSEWKNFETGTCAVAEAIAESGAVSIIGGGDSAAAVEKLGFADKMTHISTGGGASLEFLEGLELPGIACLEDK
ncbi:MAG: phosphoglycerate kinase [Clostridia bacterium]|nr:phosphoglycerate kinase [Clostridia bacterium]